MKNFDSEVEKFDKRFNSMFKLFVVIFVLALCGVLAVWGTIAYIAVTKGPETIHRVERGIDAYTDKLEQENKSNRNPE